ncbi:MAG: hypothetical protein ACOX87_08315 [Chloroflexota bacterium]
MERRARQIQLSLSRAEWETILNELDTQPETAECCAVAIDALRSHLSSVVAEPDDVVSLTQTSVAWSTLILGICLHLTHVTTLLPLAKRLRSQLEVQIRRIESPVYLENPADAQQWQPLTADDCWERIDRN